MKEAHLLGLQAAEMRWESNTAPDEAFKNIINPTHRNTIETKTKKPSKLNKAKQWKVEKRRQQRNNNNDPTLPAHTIQTYHSQHTHLPKHITLTSPITHTHPAHQHFCVDQ
jgi:hypothetical protein